MPDLNTQPLPNIEKIKPEAVPTGEVAKEALEQKEAEKRDGQAIEDNLAEIKKTGVQPADSTPVSIGTAVEQDQRLKEREAEIEKILAENLKDAYLSMTPEKQQVFKARGEEIAKKINILLQSVKVQAGKIVKLIRDWLSLVPGINKFFLEQETKIKTDKILNTKKNKPNNS